MINKKILIPIIIGLGVLVFSSVFTVKEGKQALVLQLGEPTQVITEPGLQFKIPFMQNVVFFDKRILNLDPTPEEVFASDQKRLIVDAFARYRITDPLKFYQTVRSDDFAKPRLQAILNSRIRSVVAQYPLKKLVSEGFSKQRQTIQQQIDREASSLGIEIIDVRIKRADLPQANSEAVYGRMQAEREREAKEFRAKGAEMAVTITSKADKEVTVILAEANKQAQILRGKADAERARIYAEAYTKDPEFYAFYRSLEAYKKVLSKDELILLSPESEFFDYFETSKAPAN